MVLINNIGCIKVNQVQKILEIKKTKISYHEKYYF